MKCKDETLPRRPSALSGADLVLPQAAQAGFTAGPALGNPGPGPGGPGAPGAAPGSPGIAFSAAALALVSFLLLSRGPGLERARPGVISDPRFSSYGGVAPDTEPAPPPGPWHETLLAAIESAIGTTVSHAVFAGVQTDKDDAETPAADGDRVYLWRDLKAGATNYIEGAGGKGGVLRAAGVGTRYGIQLSKASGEYFKTTQNADAGSPPLLVVGAHTVIVMAKLANSIDNSGTGRFNPLVWGSSNVGDFLSACPGLFLRDDATARLTMYEGDGQIAILNSTAAPYNTPVVLSMRNKVGTVGKIGADKTYVATGTIGNVSSLAKLMRVGFGASYINQTVGCILTIPAALTDGQLDSVVDLIRAAYGV